MYRVIDVSENNGTPTWLPIAWPTLIASGQADGVYCRIALGAARPDAAFRRNWAALRASPLLQGVYGYAVPARQPTVVAHAVGQVRYWWRLLQAAGGPHADDLPPVIDVETAQRLTPGELIQWVEAAWLEAFRLWRCEPVIYSDAWWLTTVLAPAVRQRRVWVAAYGVSAAPPVPGAQVVGWQWRDTGQIAGCATPVDETWWTGPWPVGERR